MPVESSLQRIAEDPELTEGQGDRDGQEGELGARLLAPLYSSAGRRFRQLVRITVQSPDIAGGVHVGKDDLDVGDGEQGIMFGYAGDETGKTEMRFLMVGQDAGGKTTVLFKLKLGEVVTTIPTSGFGLETVQCKDLGFTVCSVGGQDKIRFLRRHFHQGTHGLIHVVNSNDRDRVEDAKEELNKMIMREAVVLAFANTLTHSTATRLGKKLTDVHKYATFGCGMLVVQAATLEAKSRLQRSLLDVVMLTRPVAEAVGKERRLVAGQQRRCGGSHGFWNVLGSFLKCFAMTRMLVAATPRDWAIIRELKEAVCSESLEKVVYSILSTGLGITCTSSTPLCDL